MKKETANWIIGGTITLLICIGLIYISIHYEKETLAYKALRNMKWEVER